MFGRLALIFRKALSRLASWRIFPSPLSGDIATLKKVPCVLPCRIGYGAVFALQTVVCPGDNGLKIRNASNSCCIRACHVPEQSFTDGALHITKEASELQGNAPELLPQ